MEIVLDKVEFGAAVEFITDSQLLEKQFNKGPEHAKDSINADQFSSIFRQIADKNLQVRVRWMPSHLDTDDTKVRPQWVRDSDIVGNSKADKLADISAKSPLDVNVVNRYFRAVKQVLRYGLQPYSVISRTDPSKRRFLCLENP